jgi:FMN-dependent NADH-azoreductase
MADCFHGIVITIFQASVKNINHEHKNETAHIAELLVKLKADSPDLAEKVSELQKADKYVSSVLHPSWNYSFSVQCKTFEAKCTLDQNLSFFSFISRFMLVICVL